MKTFEDCDEATSYMRSMNKSRRLANNHDLVVMVDGPADDEYTVMELREAIDNDFLFTWS